MRAGGRTPDKEPFQHPLHIRIENGSTLAKGKTQHRASGVASDPWQRCDLLKGVRKHPVVAFHDLLGGQMQIARPAVVA